MNPNPYTFKGTSQGNIEVYESGKRIGTGNESFASRYGYDSTNLATSVVGANPNDPFGNPRPNSLGITGSAQITQSNAGSAATSAAAGAVGGGGTAPVLSSFEQQYMDFLKSSQDQNKDVADRALKAQELSYNAALASSNSQYDNLRRELQQNYAKDIDVANANAISLNPYSQASGATTAANFNATITSKYNQQATLIEEKSSIAKQMLEAKNYEGYSNIVNEITKSNNVFQKEMFQFKSDMNKQAEQSRQFGETLKTKYSDDYRSYLTSIPYSPEEISKMSDADLMNTTAGRLAKSAGIDDPKAVRQDMSEGSFKSQSQALALSKQELAVSKQADLQDYRNRLIEISIAKLAEKQQEGVLSTKTYTLARAGENKTDIQFSPYTNLKVTEKLKVANVISAVDLINQAEALYAKATGVDYSGVGAGVVSALHGLTRTAATVTGADQDWQAYIAFLESNKAPIAKGMKGETGNLAAQEQTDSLKSFPGRFTSPANSETAFAIVRRQSLSHLTTLGETVGTVNKIDGGGSSSNNPFDI